MVNADEQGPSLASGGAIWHQIAHLRRNADSRSRAHTGDEHDQRNPRRPSQHAAILSHFLYAFVFRPAGACINRAPDLKSSRDNFLS
jgi:hypothetical protein